MAASILHALTIAHLLFCVQLQSELKEASEKLAQASPPTVIVAAPLDPLAAQSELSDRLSAEVGRLKAEVERLTFEGMTKQPALKQLGIEIELERVKRQDMAQVGNGEWVEGRSQEHYSPERPRSPLLRVFLPPTGFSLPPSSGHRGGPGPAAGPAQGGRAQCGTGRARDAAARQGDGRPDEADAQCEWEAGV